MAPKLAIKNKMPPGIVKSMKETMSMRMKRIGTTYTMLFGMNKHSAAPMVMRAMVLIGVMVGMKGLMLMLVLPFGSM